MIAEHWKQRQRSRSAAKVLGATTSGSSAGVTATESAAIRYVERNPVRARMVRRAENYRWSSAVAHCGLKADSVLTTEPGWLRQFQSMGDWSKWLAEGDRPEQLEVLRRHVERGLPCGAEGFIRKLERQTKQLLHLRPRGRPKKA